MTLTLTLCRTPVPRDLQAAHVLAYGAAAAHPGGRVLWAAPTPDRLIIQADRPADLDHARTRTVRTDWPAGTPITWALIACPTVCGRPHPGAPTRRQVLRTDFDRTEWACRKLGAALDVTDIDVEDMGTWGGQKHGRRVAWHRVAYAGAGTVRDPDALATLIRSGVGPGKAYGCGLLLVQEAS